MKYIAFTSEQEKLFSLFYSAVLMVTDKTPLDKGDIRIHAKMLDNIEANSRAPKENDNVYRLPENLGLTLALEDSHYNLAKRIIENFPFNPVNSREIVHLYDLLDSAPSELPKPSLVGDKNGPVTPESKG